MATQPSLPNQTTSNKWKSLNEQNNNVECSIEEMQVLVTAAQLLALKTTPVVIVPAGAQIGEVIEVDSCSMSYNFNTTAFTLNAGTLKLYYGPVTNGHALTADLSTSFLTAAASRKIVNIQPLATTPDTATNLCQQPIYLANDGAANYTLGDATLTVTIRYSKTTP
jgi:hypothetical protein